MSQSLTLLTIKKIFLASNLNLPYCSLILLYLVSVMNVVNN